MTFSNTSREMRISVLVLSVVGLISTIGAALAQGVFVYKVNSEKKKQPTQYVNITLSAGRVGYALSIVSAVVISFVLLYVSFDIKSPRQ